MALADLPQRRRSDAALPTRVALVERDIEVLGHRMDAHFHEAEKTHERLVAAVEKLDERSDKMGTRLAYLFGGIAVAWSAVQIFAPAIRGALGLP